MRLTPRERQVLQLLSEGLTHQHVGFEMKIKISTVRSHVASIFRKMNVHNKREALALYRLDRDG